MIRRRDEKKKNKIKKKCFPFPRWKKKTKKTHKKKEKYEQSISFHFVTITRGVSRVLTELASDARLPFVEFRSSLRLV